MAGDVSTKNLISQESEVSEAKLRVLSTSTNQTMHPVDTMEVRELVNRSNRQTVDVHQHRIDNLFTGITITK